ncbi:MAG: integrase core domain-containing protein [Candidatus Omnitrophica bacterium]|nr:integrase core domain-containing protein [Candidatus Omnitrophota bacterium]
MLKSEERVRILAVERYWNGESPKSIYASLSRSKGWFFKWLKRYEAGSNEWFKEHSKQPLTSPNKTADDIETTICSIRKYLRKQSLFCGPQAILWQLEDDGISPLPSESTIKRILKRHGLVSRDNGPYKPKGKKYPELTAKRINDVQQFDFVGPCYLQGPVRFYSLHAMDLASKRCAVEPKNHRKDVHLMILDIWKRLGIPRFAQFDNALEFFGSQRYPRNMGQVIRLCLGYGVEPVFIPVREPWRNGVVEKFNDYWDKMFYSKVTMTSQQQLREQSFGFENRHNSKWRYSALGGKTPLKALADSQVQLKFPIGDAVKRIAKPRKGKYHVIRFIRSSLILNMFGEKFAMPGEVKYEYVKATVDVKKELLRVYRDRTQVAEFAYSTY